MAAHVSSNANGYKGFVPLPLLGFADAYRWNIKGEGKEAKVQESVRALFDAVMAAGACAATLKWGARFNIDLPKAGCLLTFMNPDATLYGTAGYVFCVSLQNLRQARNVNDVVKNVALGAIAYLVTIPKFYVVLSNVYEKVIQQRLVG